MPRSPKRRPTGRLPTPPPAGFRACVDGGSWILTREGFRAVANLAGTVAEVWTGSRWCLARVTQGKCTSSGYRIRLSNGLTLTCSKHQSCAVLGGDGGRTLRAVCAEDLRRGDVLFPYNTPRPDLSRLPPAVLESPCSPNRLPPASREIRDRARHLLRRTPPAELPQDVFKYDAASILQFVDFWAEMQGGRVWAPPECARQLHLLLLLAGVGPCRTATFGEGYEELLLPENKLIHHVHRTYPRGEARVASIERVPRPRWGNYHIAMVAGEDGVPPARSVVVEGILLLAPADTGVPAETSSSDSERAREPEHVRDVKDASASPAERPSTRRLRFSRSHSDDERRGRGLRFGRSHSNHSEPGLSPSRRRDRCRAPDISAETGFPGEERARSLGRGAAVEAQ
jgi:hypothetical protein